MKDLNIYFHIPYCKAKCRFCSFYVIPGRKSRLEEYFKALQKEIVDHKHTLQNYNIRTIYVGGGTPSLVDSPYVVEVINTIKSNFNIDPSCEISIETNPETITQGKIEDYLSVGVNRISIGLQSTDDQILKFMGRLYTFSEFKEKYSIVKDSKLQNINVDLIFGIPGLTMHTWQKSLEDAIELEPKHISTYSLEIDPDSIFGYLEKRGRFKRMEDDLDRKMYKLSKRILSSNEFFQYEISNFAANGYECKHNLNIWKGQDYIGFGASSHSRINNMRYNNINSLEKYIDLINTGQSPKENISELSTNDLLNERIILNLRTNQGINLNELNSEFGEGIISNLNSNIDGLLQQKLIKIEKNYLSLTSKGQDLENYVNLQLVNI